MARPDRDLEYTLELLEPLGPVRARSMFGGWGLYFGGSMFGLMAERRLYLKTDDITRPAFESAGCEPFVYGSARGGKPLTLSYWTPPPDALDDAHALLPWARRAVEAAQRAAMKKKPTARKAPARKAPSVKKSKKSTRRA